VGESTRVELTQLKTAAGASKALLRMLVDKIVEKVLSNLRKGFHTTGQVGVGPRIQKNIFNLGYGWPGGISRRAIRLSGHAYR
jgi:hypothetical protein